jgi:hypothetical protein
MKVRSYINDLRSLSSGKPATVEIQKDFFLLTPPLYLALARARREGDVKLQYCVVCKHQVTSNPPKYGLQHCTFFSR